MSKGTGGYVILVRFRAKAGQDRQFAKQMQSVVAGDARRSPAIGSSSSMSIRTTR